MRYIATESSYGAKAAKQNTLHQALADPQIGGLLGQKVVQLELFSEQMQGWEGDGIGWATYGAWLERHKLTGLCSRNGTAAHRG